MPKLWEMTWNLTVFDKFGPVQVYAETKPEEVVERIKDVDVVITNKVVLNKENLENASKTQTDLCGCDRNQ